MKRGSVCRRETETVMKLCCDIIGSDVSVLVADWWFWWIGDHSGFAECRTRSLCNVFGFIFTVFRSLTRAQLHPVTSLTHTVPSAVSLLRSCDSAARLSAHVFSISLIQFQSLPELL